MAKILDSPTLVESLTRLYNDKKLSKERLQQMIGDSISQKTYDTIINQ